MVFIMVFVFICIRSRSALKIDGEILLYIESNGERPICIYDCSKAEFHEISSGGSQAKFSGDNAIFIDRYDKISEYNLITQEENVVYEGETFDFFDICNEQHLSLSKDNYIFLYNIETKEKKILVQDNGSNIHSWSDDGTTLYYSDINNKINSVEILTNEVQEVGEGRDPVVCGLNIAYKHKGKLIVKNMKNNDEYTYNSNVYSYCFSPTGKELLIEDEMSFWTVIKNFFKNDIIFGHRIIAWQYESNKKTTIIDACLSNVLISDWK